MKKILPMNNFICIIALTTGAILFQSCGTDSEQENHNTTETLGGKNYGGSFRMNESEFFTSLYPHHITDDISARVASHIYEGLLRFDPMDLSLQPSLASSITIDQKGTLYHVTLKKGVKFHDNSCFTNGSGRELKASDVQYCFDELCKQTEHNIGYSQFKSLVKGAVEYHEMSKDHSEIAIHVSGIKVINDHELTIELLEPCSIFKQILASPLCYIYPKEAFDKYGAEISLHAVGTGPFMMDATNETDFKTNSHLILRKNPNYHEKDDFGNQLPFLDQLEITFLHDKKTEMELFKKGEYQMVYRLPTEEIIHLMDPENHELDEFELEDVPEYSLHYIGFNNQSTLFSDLNLRKALTFAINKKTIVNKILNGEADEPANKGITPFAFTNYPTEQIKGYYFNSDSAKHYFKKVKKPLKPIILHLSADGSRNTHVAEEIKLQLKRTLGIDITLNFLELPELESEIEHGEIDMFLLGHTSTYPNPQELIHSFYSVDSNLEPGENAFPNLTRYSNTNFDKHYRLAMSASDIETQTNYFIQCEQQIMNDAAVIPLWYDEGYRLIQPYVKNLHLNPMQYRDFREVYFEKAETIKEIQ